tara:strand:- start:45220 stop:46179 length:960 start_codon:yes stop_codon:yes gene_type:complete
MNFDYRPYVLNFKHPLKTSKGSLSSRRGIILRLQGNGNVGYGDIVCFPELGTESFEGALAFCKNPTPEIPSSLPATQFAYESALSSLEEVSLSEKKILIAGLLSSGPDVLVKAQRLLNEGYKIIKWKVGVQPLAQEQAVFQELVALAKTHSAKLRLDANGALTQQSLLSWMTLLEDYEIDFFEQPLPEGSEECLFDCAKNFKTTLALDEAVRSLEAVKRFTDLGFMGVFVIKPSLFGFMKPFQGWCANNPVKYMYSSIFETSVGLQSLLRLGAKSQSFALGLGTLAFLDQGPLSFHQLEPAMNCNTIAAKEDALWNSLA